VLAELDKTSDWAALAGVLRRILDGERGGQLLDGLDPTDTAIVTVVGRLDGQLDALAVRNLLGEERQQRPLVSQCLPRGCANVPRVRNVTFYYIGSTAPIHVRRHRGYLGLWPGSWRSAIMRPYGRCGGSRGSGMAELRLRVEGFQDAEHWRWLLQDSQGKFVADHRVALDTTESEYQGFVDLAGFLRDRAVPDRRLASEAELVDRVGGWVGKQVLGEAVGRAIVAESPVVVRVALPVDADVLLYRPLELAHVDGQPLAVQDVSLVFEVDGEALGAAKQPIGERLRMLAVFSLPTGGTALALRRERYSLTQLVRQIAGSYGRAIELHVLQYGVTRERLRDALRDGRGWDVVHFSGHGLVDGLVLERADGTADLVRTPDLVGLLRPARQRLKLVTLSSCLSAAGTTVAARRALSLGVPDQLEDEANKAATQAPLPGLARELVRQLDCAVLAMRYSVIDDFAIALDEQLYEGLFGRDQKLARAVQLALPEAAGEAPTVGAPAISTATPALFGPLAAGLSLSPPLGQPSFNVGTLKMADFPDEPERFVGRTGILARASTALAPRNQQQHNSVLFYGMAGAGKTACALELAYRHEPVFGALAFWQAPEQGKDITTSLRDLAVELESQLADFKMLHAIGSEAELRRFLPRLNRLLTNQAVLLVLDNLESLLTEQGVWRDPNWQLLVSALVGHRGNSRLVLTSRVPPAGLDGRVLVESIHALSLDESLLLARELPNLSRLLRLDEPGAPDQLGAEGGMALVRRVLSVVQGHPKLLELADAQAADPEGLRARLAEADRALPGQAGRLEAFFARGESQLAPEHFLEVLGSWTRGVARTLPEGARTLFWLLCGLEEADRWRPIVEDNWADLWRRLGRNGEPPALAEALAPLVARALVQVDQDGEHDAPTRYRVHPGVAEAARREAGEEFQAAVDAEVAAFWQAVFQQAVQAEGGEASQVVVHACLAAAPYLLRLGDWDSAAHLLEQALGRDESPVTVAALLPLLGQIVQATTGTSRELLNAGVLARTVSRVDPAEGERQLRAVLAKAVAQQAYDLATAIAGELVNVLRRTGRLSQALALVDEKEGYTRQAGFGPWTQLGDRGQRLQVLRRLGEHERVLAEVQQLREQLAGLPETSEHEERVDPWNVRESILQTGALAAGDLGRWEVALALNDEVTHSRAARHAPALEQARSRFNDYGPLLALGRLEEARALLHGCRAVYQAEGAIPQLGMVFSALADLEANLGHQQDAIALERAALRYKYAAGDPNLVAVSHYNLANHLRRAGGNPALVVAHRLAATLLDYQTGSGLLAGILRRLAGELAEFGEQAVPGSFEVLCARVGQVEGVRLAELLAGPPGPAGDGDQALAEVLRLARDLPATPADRD
jgi:tetratricopeptide (TPR) repeat protein